jgi:predicted RNA-binding protein associated with RNAse of E/G family
MTACIEKKLTLSGAAQVFECELLRLDASFGMLKYVIDREYTISNVTLRPGDTTYALYWRDRPYTVYIWKVSKKQFIYYFNIADSISLHSNEIMWRDLSIDILVDADSTVHVLDEDELPSGLPVGLVGYIQSAKGLILHHYQDIMLEVNSILSAQGVYE